MIEDEVAEKAQVSDYEIEKQGSQILAVETRKDGRNITLQLDAGSDSRDNS